MFDADSATPPAAAAAPEQPFQLSPSEAVRLFEQQIVKFRLKENWSAVQSLKKLAAALGLKLDRPRIRRATIRQRMRRSAKRRAAYHRQRAGALGLNEHFSGQEWLDLLAFYRYRCCHCGRDTVKLEIDHVIALSEGGSNRIENIQPLCTDCHTFFCTIGRQEDHRRRLPDWFEPRQKSPRQEAEGRRQKAEGGRLIRAAADRK